MNIKKNKKGLEVILFLVVLLQTFNIPARSEDQPRPPSVFSKCYCTVESKTVKETSYKCDLYEEAEQPLESKLLPGHALDCPGNIIISNYKK